MMQRKGKIREMSLRTRLSGVISTSYSSQKRDMAIKRKI